MTPEQEHRARNALFYGFTAAFCIWSAIAIVIGGVIALFLRP